MPEFKVNKDRVYQVKIAGESIQISNGSFDHAVRYPDQWNWLDHLAIFSPVGIPFEDEETGESGMMGLLNPQRYFLGAVAVETVVAAINLHEIYATEITEAVHDDYLDQASNHLDKLDFDIEE